MQGGTRQGGAGAPFLEVVIRICVRSTRILHTSSGPLRKRSSSAPSVLLPLPRAGEGWGEGAAFDRASALINRHCPHPRPHAGEGARPACAQVNCRGTRAGPWAMQGWGPQPPGRLLRSAYRPSYGLSFGRRWPIMAPFAFHAPIRARHRRPNETSTRQRAAIALARAVRLPPFAKASIVKSTPPGQDAPLSDSLKRGHRPCAMLQCTYKDPFSADPAVFYAWR